VTVAATSLVATLVAATSLVSLVFAAISLVSAGLLAYFVATDDRRAKPVDGAAQFRRHLAALSDDSREHLREQIRIARDRRSEA
jgi:membrane protein implicated in regulation of membrane protease activity